MAAVRRLAAHYAFVPEGFVRDIVVTVDGEGTILAVERTDRPDTIHGIEFYSGILVPGFINAHCHLELSHMMGLIPQGCGFAGFGKAMGECRDSHTRAERAASAAYHDAKMWSEGISAVGDISNSDTCTEVKCSSRTKYHTFVEVYGLGLDSTQRFDSLMHLTKEKGLAASLTPHSMYSLNERTMREAVTGGDGILSVHFMESPGEAELFRGGGEMKRWYDEKGFNEDFTATYRSPAGRLVRTVPGDRKILLVHNTFATEEDIEKVNGHFGPNVTWVLCPRSNEYITGSLPPAELLARKGCRIAVGTDSLASNTSLSMIGELKTLGGELEKTLRWATITGAEALQMDELLGSIEPGKKPGVALIENIDPVNMRLTSGSTSRRLV